MIRGRRLPLARRRTLLPEERGLLNNQSMLLGGGAAASSGFADGADFNGTNTFMSKAAKFTGQTDSQSGIFCARIFPDVGGGCIADFRNGGSGTVAFQVNCINSGGTDWGIRIIARSAGATILQLDQTATRANNTGWYGVLASWNLATAGHRWLYIDNTDETTQTTFTNATIAYSTNGDQITMGDNGAGSSKFNGGVAELFIGFGQELDFSNSANRNKFQSGGHPISLGATGSTPTGTAPTFYAHLDHAEAVANFATNRAGNGNVTVSGTMTTRGTQP